MVWSILSACGSFASLVAIIIGAAYLSGQFSEKIRAAEDQINKHGERISDLEIQVAKLEQWKEGFNAAAFISGGKIVNPTME